MARLVYFRNEDSSEEGVVIDTANMSSENLEKEFGMPVNEILELDSPCHGWPTDRLLLPE